MNFESLRTHCVISAVCAYIYECNMQIYANINFMLYKMFTFSL